MEWYEALLLGLVQGLTEFLPVSSSGHLEIGQAVLGTAGEENLTFTVTLHVATVLSTLVVLRKEIWALIQGCFGPVNPLMNPSRDYVAKILVSMIPVFVVGMFFKDQVEAFFGSGLLLVGGCLLVTAALLTFAHFAKPRVKAEISYLDAFVIGVAQAIAVLPGLSRSGSTIATGLLLGDRKESVAQFSFLMVIVPILGEAFLDVLKAIKDPGLVGSGLGIAPLAVGFAAAFVSGLFACKFMIELVKRQKLIGFAVYCCCAGLFAILWQVLA
ncbi:MAG: undecaprenyl-diphosphate phosphatase [Paludibacteraceae bacterium]|nr:undecaprenyl-diphosphate phosphatase [Paludibacteraceae bacterium]